MKPWNLLALGSKCPRVMGVKIKMLSWETGRKAVTKIPTIKSEQKVLIRRFHEIFCSCPDGVTHKTKTCYAPYFSLFFWYLTRFLSVTDTISEAFWAFLPFWIANIMQHSRIKVHQTYLLFRRKLKKVIGTFLKAIRQIRRQFQDDR